MERLQVRRIQTDVLIVGGGTAGCYAALTISRNSNLSVLIAEKANIKRSGCLAAGVNAINAYITKGHVPQDYVDYATKDIVVRISDLYYNGFSYKRISNLFNEEKVLFPEKKKWCIF